eukprot:6077815-Alexandrium_andersonii.AAC.1
MEANFDLVNQDSILKDDNLSAGVIKGFHVTVLHILRKMIDNRRQHRKGQMDEKARQGYRINQPMDPSFLQH